LTFKDGHDKLGKIAELICKGSILQRLIIFAVERPNLKRFDQICKGLAKFAEVWQNLQRLSHFAEADQIYRYLQGIAKFADTQFVQNGYS